MKIKMRWLSVALLAGLLSACVEYDESTYITDDAGRVHHTIHYTRDKRGEIISRYHPTHRSSFVCVRP